MRPWRSGNASGSHPDITGSSPVGRSMKNTKIKWLVGAVLSSLIVVSCTPQQVKVANTSVDVVAAACEVIVSSTDPKLAPLCSTAQAVAKAVSALIEAHASTDQPGIKPAMAPYQPTRDEVYTYLAAHGALPVDH